MRHQLRDFASKYATTFRLDAAAETKGKHLTCHYRLIGPIADLVIPTPSAQPRFRDELWKHTCFEIFLAEGSRYFEGNFSPSGEYAFYAFSAYRERIDFDPASVQVSIRQLVDSAEVFELIADVQLPFSPQGMSMSLTAVIESKAEGVSYWAEHHARARPDFHAAESFRLQLR